MDLNKATDPEKLRLCRIYFLGGLALLPFLWFVNVFWFFKQAFLRKPEFAEQKEIRKYVVLSSFGAVFWTCVLIGWIVTFQLKRVEWGATGDSLSFVYPRGKA